MDVPGEAVPIQWMALLWGSSTFDQTDLQSLYIQSYDKMKMSQQDAEQSASQYKSSTDQFHIKVEPETHNEDTPLVHTQHMETGAQRRVKEVLIKEEPIEQNEYYLELEPIKDEPNVDDELTDTQVKSAIPSENVAVDQSELGSLEDVQEDKQFKCNICREAFSMLAYLKTHSCTGKKPYKCNICDKDFKFASKLKYHIRTHTGEKPFKCNACDKTFKRQGQLKIHIRGHTGDKPFRCDTCGNTFIRHDHLKIHIRTHTGEKPYTCDNCGKRFARSDTLKCHIESCGISSPPRNRYPPIVSNETDFIYSHLFR